MGWVALSLVAHLSFVFALQTLGLLQSTLTPEPAPIRVFLDRSADPGSSEAAVPVPARPPDPPPRATARQKPRPPTPARVEPTPTEPAPVVAAVAPAEVPAPADTSTGADVAAAPAAATSGGVQLASLLPGGTVEGVGRSGPQDAEAAIAAYVDLVRKRIERAKRYPGLARSRHVEGTVLALIHLGPGGSVNSVEILDSPSGLLSDPTREAIVASGPFPPPPGELRRIRVPVRYALQ